MNENLRAPFYFATLAIACLVVFAIRGPPDGNAGGFAAEEVFSDKITELTAELIETDEAIDNAGFFGRTFLEGYREGKLEDIAFDRSVALQRLIQEDPQAFLSAATLTENHDDFPDVVVDQLESAVTLEGVYQFVAHHSTNDEAIVPYGILIGEEGISKVYGEALTKEEMPSTNVVISGVSIGGKVALRDASLGEQLIAPVTKMPEVYRLKAYYVEYTDSEKLPFDPQDLDDRIMLGGPNRIFREMSDGKTQVSIDLEIVIIDEPAAGRCLEYQAVNDRWKKLPEGKYDGLVLFDNEQCGASGWAWVGKVDYYLKDMSVARVVTTKDKFSSYRGFLSPKNGPSDWKGWDFILVHELGHNFGLWHANRLSCAENNPFTMPPCVPIEYGNQFDMMGSSSHGYFGAPLLRRLGWLADDSVVRVVEPGVYDLLPLSSGAGPRVLMIPSNNAKAASPLFVEYRTPATMQGTSIERGLLLMVDGGVNGHVGFNTLVVDPFPGDMDYASGVSNLLVLEGAGARDTARNIGVELLSATDEKAQVRVYWLNSQGENSGVELGINYAIITSGWGREWDEVNQVTSREGYFSQYVITWIAPRGSVCELVSGDEVMQVKPSGRFETYSFDLPKTYTLRCSVDSVIKEKSVAVPMPPRLDLIKGAKFVDLPEAKVLDLETSTSVIGCSVKIGDYALSYLTATTDHKIFFLPQPRVNNYDPLMPPNPFESYIPQGTVMNATCRTYDPLTESQVEESYLINFPLVLDGYIIVYENFYPQVDENGTEVPYTLYWSIAHSMPASCNLVGEWSGKLEALEGSRLVHTKGPYGLECTSTGLSGEVLEESFWSDAATKPSPIISYFISKQSDPAGIFDIAWESSAEYCEGVELLEGTLEPSGKTTVSITQSSKVTIRCVSGSQTQTMSMDLYLPPDDNPGSEI